jgi:hypothetical protein
MCVSIERIRKSLRAALRNEVVEFPLRDESREAVHLRFSPERMSFIWGRAPEARSTAVTHAEFQDENLTRLDTRVGSVWNQSKEKQ